MTRTGTFWQKYRSTILYGVSLAVLLFVLQWLKWSALIYDHAFELYIGAIALLFTGLGIWLALKLSKPRVETIVIEKEIRIPAGEPFVADEGMITRLDLSKRELEVLGLMAKGLSNQEIAERLFVSLSTVKTHNQSIFAKLDVKRRTQAIEKAKTLRIIA